MIQPRGAGIGLRSRRMQGARAEPSRDRDACFAPTIVTRRAREGGVAAPCSQDVMG